MIRIVEGTWRRSTGIGIGGVALGTAESFEVGNGYQSAGVRQCRIAGFVPVVVVFPANDVEEVAA